MKKIFILFAYCLLLTAYCSSQSWQWAKHFGSIGGGDDGTLCLDSSGNSYLTGTFSYPYGIFGNDTVQVVGPVFDAFIVKMDNNGNFIWSKRAGGSESFSPTVMDYGTDILYDKSDNSIIFCGTFESLPPSKAYIGTCQLMSGSQNFLSKLDTGGNCIWAKYEPVGAAGRICTDNNGYIYMIGAGFSQPTSFCNTTVPTGATLAKFNSSNGSCVWAKKITEYVSGGTAISYYNNKLYIGGVSVNDTLMLDTATAYCYPNDIFISEFDTAGNVQWVKTMGGPNTDVSSSISLDGSGNIYITGLFKDTAYFDSTILTNGNNKDWFLAKYDNSGNFIWARQAHISGNFYFGHTVSSNVNGNVYVTGGFSGSATFGTYSVTATTAADMFIARYDNNGNCIGVEQIANYIFNGAGRVINENTGGFYIAGSFKDTSNFGSYPLYSYGGGTDVFVARHDAISGIQQLIKNSNNQLLIYANPNEGKCNITVPDDLLNEKNLVLSIYDNTGKLIQQKTLQMNDGKIKLDLEAEAKGIYNVVLSSKKKSYSGKIVFE